MAPEGKDGYLNWDIMQSRRMVERESHEDYHTFGAC